MPLVVLQAVEDAFVPVIKMTFDGIEVSYDSDIAAIHLFVVFCFCLVLIVCA